jgi:PAS domain S-box-containing protein
MRLSGICQDVTERVESRTWLERSEELLGVTLRSIADAVVSVDKDGRIILMNLEAERLTGWDMSSASGKPFSAVFKLVDEITREDIEDPIGSILSGSRPKADLGHASLVSRDGSQACVEGVAAPLSIKEGPPMGAVAIFRDVTGRRKTDEALRRAESFESLGSLAGGIAHDFNNLLGGIFGYINLADSSLQRGNYADVAGYMAKAASVYERARDLATRLLSFSKGGAPVKKQGDIARTVWETAEFSLSGSNVSLEVRVPQILPACRFDQNQIGQVIENMVINAKQAMDSGGRLTIGVVREDIGAGGHPVLPPGPYVRIEVEDSGPGIEAELLSKIFDPFFTTKKSGTGLGLATCLSIAKRHGGWIDVESTLGKGTRFIIWLPIETDPLEREPGRPAAGIVMGSGRILILDDEEYNREIGAEIFTLMGFEASAVRDGDEALSAYASAKAENRPFKAVVLDLTLPGGAGGEETLRRIATLDKNVKAVAASGYATDPVITDPCAYGFAASLKKPFRMEDVARIIPVIMGKAG